MKITKTNTAWVMAWISETIKDVKPREGEPGLIIFMANGIQIAKEGDYIVKDLHGGFGTIKGDLFEEMFTPISEAPISEAPTPSILLSPARESAPQSGPVGDHPEVFGADPEGFRGEDYPNIKL